ncbi:AAA family ATPase [Frankia sp. CNm7]|uniref:AAA family ATPase n=1 Tax=Frankia nepalensis TaxID=1836974 RepID=A0A937RI63_9ACTN|nr:AAA family ATPase [Frankia nepalensis]MBL7501166.1 AAA family ATPase [Frankia nepalensis]MBL7512632.1 AAA family ATPase [Frankia nepalensis]MBL7518585.1 AAA family ATPase [Frankia nepalensis]MBL7632688.1 AAA family ATPase [Frankia nepalensis]
MDLLERDRERAALGTAITRASAGEGSGVAVTGESGSGKSALLEAARLAAPDVRFLLGSCDPLGTPRPLGPFRDIAAAAGLGPLLRGEELMLAQVCEQIYDALRGETTVLVVEDLHWVDAASAEVLRFLARRVDSMPLALLVSYRDDEIGPGHSARPLLGDFARLGGFQTLRLRPLSVEGVGTLVRDTRLEPRQVHALTGGNPFFVTEVAGDPDRPLPTSVRDAVLARAADVTPEDFEVLQLVATAPDRLDDRVLPALGVDLPTLRRLDTTGLLTRARGGLVFRHELARQAVESTIPPGGASRLHARLLAALERIEPRDPAVLTHHAVAARDSARATGYATAAARQAIAAGSHSEAAAFFETALEHLGEAAPAERADLLHKLAFEHYMTSRLREAITNVTATFPLWRQADDHAGLAAAYDTCAVFEYYNARRRQAEAHADRAASVSSTEGHELTLALARATRGYLAFWRGEVALAQRYCDESHDAANRLGHEELALRGSVVRAACAILAGEADARATLADDIETARARGWDELASTGYSNLANLDVEQRRYREAEHVLEESLPFTVERDIPICRHWQTAVRSRLHLARGRWSAAVEDAEQVLEDQGMPLAMMWPHLVAVLVPLRRGADVATAHLDAAWRLAEQLDEPLRRLAVLSTLAERMWMTEQSDPLVTGLAAHELKRLATAPGAAWAAGELAVWLGRLDLLTERPDPLAPPFRLSLEGCHDEAASWWRRAGEPFAEAMAWCDSPDPGHRARGVELLDQLGATGTADRQRAALRRDGVTQLPRRPRTSTRANPAGLTNRQLDVAKLVARGLTNAEIAARLYISVKTADHHVSAVLTKLGLPTRRAVALRADELGLV